MRDKNLIGGLVKGIHLIEAFDSAHTHMTTSEAARRTGITPAAARRCLLTLCEVGYAKTDGKRYWLSHGALRVAYAYTASTRLPRLLQPALDSLSERTRESASLAVLHNNAVIIAGRSTARRSLTVGLSVGSLLPLHCSATGRTLLASLPVETCAALTATLAMPRVTDHTNTDPHRLRILLAACRKNGYATCDQELEIGVRSMAVPILNEQGDTVAALSISSRADRMTQGEMIQKLLPSMLRVKVWARSRLD